MREILFRGKTKKGEWVEGYLFEAKYYLDDHKTTYILDKNAELYPRCEVSSYEEVIPETVGQYTGFRDKNGKKIFEGDVVRFDYKTPSYVKIILRTVIFDEEFAEFEFDRNDDVRNPDGLCLCTDNDHCEIIGNIHDTPELVRKKG